MVSNKIEVLDTTLRDGGLGLEDAYLNGLGLTVYYPEEVKTIINSLVASNIDIIELGAIEISENDKSCFGIYQNLETISKLIPYVKPKNQMFVGLYRGPDTPIDDIPNSNSTFIEGVRVILRYSELKKSLEFCAALSKKGYKVFVQPMLTMRYSDDELDMIVKYSNSMNAYAVYFVDSYGYMNNDDVDRLFDYFDQRLNSNIRIGFHAHNNLNLAFANAQHLLKRTTNRITIFDSCAIGMGQGAGNLQTELFINYLNSQYNKKYDLNSILDVCDIVEGKAKESLWGYSVSRFLPAIYKTAYKYSCALRNTYHFTYREINEFLKKMPDEYRNRYTKQFLSELLKK